MQEIYYRDIVGKMEATTDQCNNDKGTKFIFVCIFLVIFVFIRYVVQRTANY